MADPRATQRLRSFFEEDDDKKKDDKVQVSTSDQGGSFQRRDTTASSLRDQFADFSDVAPSRQKKQEQQVEQVVEPLPRQKGEYRGNIFQKLGQSYVDVIKSVPNQTAKGLGMIFNAPENAATFAGKQLMKNDSYSNFMTDAARGIDLGEGRAAVGILNTAVLGIGNVKPVLNTKVGKEIVTNVADKTSNLPLKTVARFRAIGEGTYKEYRDAMIEDRNDPNNGKVEQFLYELQDSGVQSLVGILVTTGTVLATRNPKAGYAIGGAYYGSLSAAEQIQSEGEVVSSGNIYIDVIGDSLINNALLGVFKMPAAAVTRVLATAGLEGSTEVVQSLLKFGNSYTQAKTDAERQEILEDAAYYVKSGAILMEFGVGAVVGGVAQGGVEVLNSAGSSKTRTDVKNSLAFDIEAAIEAGDVDPAIVFENGTDGVLTDGFAEGRINDVAQKLGKLDPALETQYRNSIEAGTETMESIIAKGEAVLDTWTSPTAAGTEEVLNTAGSKQPPKERKLDGDIYKDIAKVTDLIARADSGAELSVSEQQALVQARQSFNDYAQSFQATTIAIENEVSPSDPPIVQIQVVDVGDKVALKYTADAGDTGLQIDYDLNTLYSSPETATEAAIDSLIDWARSQRENPNVSAVTQRRLEDIVNKVRPPKQKITPPKKPADNATPPEDTSRIAVGTVVTFGGKTRRVTAVIPFGGDTKYQLTADNGSVIYTNQAGAETAIEAKKLGITEEEVLKRRNEVNGTPKNKKKEIKVDELSQDGTVENRRVVAFETGRNGATKIVVYNEDKSEAGEIISLEKAEKKYGTTDRTELANRIINGRFDSATDSWTLIAPKKSQKDKVKEVIDEKGEASIEEKTEGQNWRIGYDNETDVYKKADILEAIANGNSTVQELNDVLDRIEMLPANSSLINTAYAVQRNPAADEATRDYAKAVQNTIDASLNPNSAALSDQQIRELEAGTEITFTDKQTDVEYGAEVIKYSEKNDALRIYRDDEMVFGRAYKLSDIENVRKATLTATQRAAIQQQKDEEAEAKEFQKKEMAKAGQKLEPSRRVTELVESYVAGEKEVEKVEVLLESINFQDPKEKKKGDELNKRIADVERGNKSAVDQLVEITGLPTNVILDGISFYISKGEKTITDFYGDINRELAAQAEAEVEQVTETEVDFENMATVANGRINDTFDTRFDEPSTPAEKLAVKLVEQSKKDGNTDDLTKQLNEKLAKEEKGFSFVGSGKDEHIEIFNLKNKKTDAELKEENEARRVALEVQYHGTQSGEALSEAIFNGTVRVSEQGIIGKGFYVTPTKSAAEYFGKQILDGNSRRNNGETPTVVAIDMSQLKVKVQDFGKQEYYDFLDANNLSPDQYNNQLKEQGYDALYLEGRGETVIFDAKNVRTYATETAEATADTLVAEGKPVKAENVRNNANTLTIVPDSLEIQIEYYNKQGFTDSIAKNRAKDKKRLADGTEVDRTKQLVTKTKLKDLLGGRDRAVFTVLDSGEGSRTTLSDTMYLYEKTETSETYLRPSALGLVEGGLVVGQEVVLDVSELKGKGTYLNAVDSKGNILAEGLFGKKKYDPAKHEKYVVDYRPRGFTGKHYIFAIPKGQGAFYRRIIDDARTKSGKAATGHQDVNGKGIWHISSTPYKQLVGQGAIYKGEVNGKIKATLQRNKKALMDSYKRPKEFAEEITPRKKLTARARNEFDAVSKRVQKAEPAGKKPSVFASREPKRDSKLKDVALDAEALQKGSPVEYEKLAKRSEIARVLTSKLGVVVRSGKFRQAANGIYKQDTNTIRLSKKNFSKREGGQLTTLIHEVGHYVDYSVQNFRAMIPKGEIAALLENYGNGAASVPANKKRSEAFAEFMRYYLTMPAEAKKRAPEFSKIFETTIAAMPEIKDVLETTQREFRRWAEQPATAKVAAQISFEQDKKEGELKQRLNTTVNSIYRDAVNDLHALAQFSSIAKQTQPELAASKDPYILARNMRGWVGRAQYFLESGTLKREYWKKGDNGRFSVEKQGKALKEILQPVEDKGALNDLSVYLVARRAVELGDRDITTGITVEDAKVALAEMLEKHPEFSEVAIDLETYQNQLLDYLQESGVLNGEDRAKMQEANKMYVPFYRVQEELANQGYMGGKGIPTKNPIKRIKGSERDIVDPIESIVKNTYVLLQTAERNNVMLAMSNLAKDNPTLGSLFERVPEDMGKVASVNARDIVEQALGKNIGKNLLNDPKGTAAVQAAAESDILDTVVDIFRPSMFQKGNVVTVLEDGKPKYYELEKDLYEALNATEVEEAIAIVKILSYPAQFLRAGATLAPEFMVRNPLRDSIGAAIMSKNGFIPFVDTFRGFASLIKKDEYYEAFVISGGLQSTIVAQDRGNLKQSRDELLKRSARIKKLIKKPLEVLQIISSYTEQATRIGEARLALNLGKDTTQAAFDSREVTLDFQRAGAKTRSVNRLSAFFNAKIQGNDKLVRTFLENPAKASLKATMYITMPSVILWFLNQDEEGWDEIPQWQKDIYWLVKVDGTWYRIPKPFELGILFGSIPERFLDYLKDNDPAGLQEISRSFVTGLVPNPMPTGMIPVLENTTNYSFFLDRPIVSDSLENLPNADQYSANTSEVSKLVGSAINYSPAKLDNLLYGYFAGLGRHTVNATDAILKGTGIVPSVTEPTGTKADIPVFKAFVVRDPAGSSSNSVNDFYESRTESTKLYNKYRNLLEEGERDKAREYLADNPEIKLYKPYNQIASQISDIRSLRDQVYNSETLTADEKRVKIDQLNALMTDTAYRANNIELE